MSRRTSWIVALLVLIGSVAALVLIGGSASAEQSPVAVPSSSESARADATRGQFPGGDAVPAVLVVTRADGGALTPGDLAAIDAARLRALSAAAAGPAGP